MPRCSTCDAEILWVQMETGGRMPVDAKAQKVVIIDEPSRRGRVVSAHVSHFVTCPDADQHRRGR